MPAHRSALSQRAPRSAAGGRHRGAPAPRSLGARAATLGATGATTAGILALGIGLAAPLDAGAAIRPATSTHHAPAVQHASAARQATAATAATVATVVHPATAVHAASAAQPATGAHRAAAHAWTAAAGIVKASPAGVLDPPHVVHAIRTPPRVQVSTLGVRAVRLAATRAGDPYVYGAEGPRAFDCSGLVQWVFDHLHRDLPRTAGAQYDATRHISHSRARAGDLVFFASGGRIYHVAIYAGHGWIWAAPYPGRDVEKEKLWTNDYMVGRVR